MEALNALKTILSNKYDVHPDKVLLEATLIDLGLDSLTIVEMAFDVEDHFRIKLNDDEQLMSRTLRGLVMRIDEQLSLTAS